MQQLLDGILTINLISTTVVFLVAARIYLVPRLASLDPAKVLVPILLLHSLRHLGLMFLTRGAVYAGMPPEFAYPAAFGDLVTAGLAFACIPLVRRDWNAARPLVWTFNVFGTLDLLNAIALATIYGASVSMGPAYWIPASWVPALLVTHYVTFIILARKGAPMVAARIKSS